MIEKKHSKMVVRFTVANESEANKAIDELEAQDVYGDIYGKGKRNILVVDKSLNKVVTALAGLSIKVSQPQFFDQSKDWAKEFVSLTLKSE